MLGLRTLAAVLIVACCFPSVRGDEPFNEQVERRLAQENWPGVIRSAIGVTRRETAIPSLLTADDLDYNSAKTRILLVGGLDGAPASVDATLAALRWFYTADEAQPLRKQFAVSAVPIANPDGWAAAQGQKPNNGPARGDNLAGGNPLGGYPPRGNAYNSPTDPEAAYLWRWVGMHAPDLLIEVRAGAEQNWRLAQPADAALERLAGGLSPVIKEPASDALFSQVTRTAPANVGTVPALRIDVSAARPNQFLPALLQAMQQAEFTGPSPAHRELQQRLDRTPVEVAEQLSRRYGHELNAVAYIPALALVGRVRLGRLTGDSSHLADVERIVAPYYQKERRSLPANVNGSILSGHLVFGELADLTEKDKQPYIDLVRAAADFAFDSDGRPREAMPYHNEMSDAVFMGCAILMQAGRLTGEEKYYDMALRHLRFMLKLNLRPDGLHRHSPLDEAAWGRGNGFPALGLALSLSDCPETYRGRDELLQAHRAHLQALLKHQDPTGAWRQVVDHPGSYRELTATCMIAYAMIRGVRSGWLDEDTYRPAIERAWATIKTRVAPDGTLVDVCTGTGKQRDLRSYFDRTAILGPDPRGGAMALMVSTEMAQWEVGSRGRGRGRE